MREKSELGEQPRLENIKNAFMARVSEIDPEVAMQLQREPTIQTKGGVFPTGSDSLRNGLDMALLLALAENSGVNIGDTMEDARTMMAKGINDRFTGMFYDSPEKRDAMAAVPSMTHAFIQAARDVVRSEPELNSGRDWSEQVKKNPSAQTRG